MELRKTLDKHMRDGASRSMKFDADEQSSRGFFSPFLRFYAFFSGQVDLQTVLVTIVALLLRLPYWEVIPASFDEVGQTSYAYRIAQGGFFPLVSNDAYTGPFYVYLLAFLFRLGIEDPMIGRMVVLITGTLTVPLTYSWVTAISRSKTAAMIAAMLVAVNPDLILVNSHIGGATFLLPFFTMLFLLGITLAVRQDDIRWLILSGVAAGLALQSNPIAGLLIAGSTLWFFFQTRHKPYLGKWWPFWPIFLATIVFFIYVPVIIYNLTTDFQTVSVLNERSYLWQKNPTVFTTWTNLQRLSLQIIRQASGVLGGSERFENLVGIPLLFLMVAIAGLVYTSNRISTLPVFVIIPFLTVLPIFSNHYGFISVGRFTTLLIPVWMGVMGILLAKSIASSQQFDGLRSKVYTTALLVLISTLLIYPLKSLFQYYQSINASHESGYALLELSRYAANNNRGEPIYISTIDELAFLSGVPYVPHTAFLIADIHHEFLRPQEIIGRIYENPRPSYFLLSDSDALVLEEVISLKRLEISANEEAAMRNYGLYRWEAEELLPKPDFVLTKRDISNDLTPVVKIGEGVWLLGCDAPAVDLTSRNLSLNCYWQATEPMPQALYVGFAHLLDLETTLLVAQDDHILGQERYPLNAWRSDDIIKEQYRITLPDNLKAGEYQLLIGIYTWPDLIRLKVEGNPDNVIVLPSIDLMGAK